MTSSDPKRKDTISRLKTGAMEKAAEIQQKAEETRKTSEIAIRRSARSGLEGLIWFVPVGLLIVGGLFVFHVDLGMILRLGSLFLGAALLFFLSSLVKMGNQDED